ncbi:MAG: DAK2 domain-containing protein [Lachnospiraceae bacterium]|nr:DAK2 domain-containing protein [Lachnospiraceae bacterium]
MNQINASTLQKMFLGGAKRIEANKEYINELNVFPVPDGDTGTNMSMTIMSAAKEVGAIENPTMNELSKAISSGSLRGARGNSGVILSQLFRGFTRAIKEKDVLTTANIAEGFDLAVQTAYKAVMKPKEGTILTVARVTAERAAEAAEETKDIDTFCKTVLEAAEEILAKTQDMLPVLKEAGVVDSGGQGLLEVLKGAYDAFLGKEIDVDILVAAKKPASAPSAAGSDVSTADIKFGYCTEFIIMLEKEFGDKEEQEMKEFLTSIGDSLVVVADDEIVKVHVHTNHPGQAFEKALTFGSLTNMKIDNMRLEHEEKLIKDASKIAAQQEAEEKTKKAQERKKNGFIAVSVGSGMNEIFKGLGVDYLIEGGQTMNPSTEDMLNAIDQVNADHIFILPNNKNIILAAEQARDLVEDKDIIVIPTKTVPQGIAAVISFVPDAAPEDNEEAMQEAISYIKTGQVTYAVRDTSVDGKEIKINDIMGIDDDGIKAVGQDVSETTLELLKGMVDEDSELISIYYGQDIEEADAEEFVEVLEEAFPDCDVELQKGGQPIYYYVLSVE